MEAIINEYEECIELIGHLKRMFNKEGYWDFKDRILVIYNQAVRNEENLKELMKVMNAVHMHYMESGYIEDEDTTRQSKLITSESEDIINLGVELRLAAELKVPLDDASRVVAIKKFINNKGYECYNLKYNVETNGYEDSLILDSIDNKTWKDYINKISVSRSKFIYE